MKLEPWTGGWNPKFTMHKPEKAYKQQQKVKKSEKFIQQNVYLPCTIIIKNENTKAVCNPHQTSPSKCNFASTLKYERCFIVNVSFHFAFSGDIRCR